VRGNSGAKFIAASSPPARQYYSDVHTLYEALIYTPGQQQGLSNKSQICSVEGDDAE